MVKLYSDRKYVSGNIISDNDAAFIQYVNAKSVSLLGREYMRLIDGAELIDENIGTIRTPFGVTVLGNLSTGAKTVLNLLYLQDKKNPIVLDITGCGTNALNAVFALMDGYNGPVKILLEHPAVHRCDNYNFLVDDKHQFNNTLDLCTFLMEESLNRNI